MTLQCRGPFRTRHTGGFGSRPGIVGSAEVSLLGHLSAPLALAVSPVGAVPSGAEHREAVGDVVLRPHGLAGPGVDRLRCSQVTLRDVEALKHDLWSVGFDQRV